MLAIEGELDDRFAARSDRRKAAESRDANNDRVLSSNLRAIKDRDEMAEIREAIRFAEDAYRRIRASARPDQTEKEFADALEHEMRGSGAKCASFPPIVAVGPRAALPHARPTQKRLGEAGYFLLDWGASGRLYKSDLTRVVGTGRIPPKLERVYRVVLKAQAAAIAAIRPGASCHDVDNVARSDDREGRLWQEFRAWPGARHRAGYP